MALTVTYLSKFLCCSILCLLVTRNFVLQNQKHSDVVRHCAGHNVGHVLFKQL